jgi:hypothetical protein
MSELDVERLARALAAELHVDEAHGFPPGFTVQELADHVAAEYARPEPLRFEVRPNDDGSVDEVLIYADGECVFHLEQLDDDAYWFAWYGNEPERHFDIRRRRGAVVINERDVQLTVPLPVPGKPVMSVAMSDADEGPA